MRTAIGVGALTFYVVLFLAGSQDIGAQKLAVSIPSLTRVFQVMVVVVPVLAGLLAWKVCHDLTGGDELEEEKERIRERIEAGRPVAPRPAAATETLAPLVFRVAAGAVTAVAALRRVLGAKAPARR